MFLATIGHGYSCHRSNPAPTAIPATGVAGFVVGFAPSSASLDDTTRLLAARSGVLGQRLAREQSCSDGEVLPGEGLGHARRGVFEGHHRGAPYCASDLNDKSTPGFNHPIYCGKRSST